MISPLRGGGKLADKIFNKYNITKEEREEVKNEIASGGDGGGDSEEEYTYWGIGKFEDVDNNNLSVEFTPNIMANIDEFTFENINASGIVDVIFLNIIMYTLNYQEGIGKIYDDLNAKTQWIMFKFKNVHVKQAHTGNPLREYYITNPYIMLLLSSNPNISLPPEILENPEGMEEQLEQQGIMKKITKEEYEDVKNRYRTYFNIS